MTDSRSVRCFMSAVTADMPLIQQFFDTVLRISSIALSVASAEVVSSKNTAMTSVSPLLNASRSFCGSTSFGMRRSVSDS